MGSFRRAGTTAQRLEGKTTELCQSSIVKQDSDGSYSYLAITHDLIRHKSAYTTELIAQTLAMRFSNGIVHIDCKSAIDAQQRISLKGHALLQLTPPSQAQRLVHVLAHPELIKAAADYTVKDTGIFLADAVASGQLEKAELKFDDRYCHIVSDLEVLTHLSRDIPHPFVSNQRGQLNLEPLLQKHQHQIHAAYLRRRDE